MSKGPLRGLLHDGGAVVMDRRLLLEAVPMPLAAAVPRAVSSHKIAGRRIVGTIAWRATGPIISAVIGRPAEQSGSPDRRVSRIGGKITGKEAVGRKVAMVVTAIIVPRVIGGEIAPQEGLAACGAVRPRVLGKA
jgi:hypothetical protein